MSPLESALAYAAVGIAVIPCEPASKQPCGALVPPDRGPDRKPVKGTGGIKKATHDPATITKWWTMRPDAMIGAATGSASGFWAIDPDVPKPSKNGHAGKMSTDGTAAWAKLKAEHGGHEPTIEVTTPSGGRHVYFKADPGRPLGNGEGALSGLGINVRGDGGYVILPPSRRWPDDKPYAANQPLAPAAIAEAPPWLYELIKPSRKAAEGAFLCTPENTRKLRDALFHIPADAREMWLKVGGALNSLGQEWGSVARELWDEWSQTEPGSFDAEDQNKTWEGFDPARPKVATVATIFFEAKERGWTPVAAAQWTELGNAHRLVRRHGDDVRYVHPLKAWFIWDGVFWRRDDCGEILRRAEATIEAIFDEAKEIADEEIRTALRKFALKSQARAQISAMVQLAQHQLRVVLSPGALDADPMLLGVLNGTIDLKACAFREGRRQDYITKQCAVAFDPAAQCPNWIEFQNKIAAGDAELVAYKQRVFGLLLTGEMVEILFILHGDGQNGKTTELETISGVLGDYAHAADAKILLAANDRAGATPEIVAIKGKRAVFINETDGSDHLNESRVKYLTGNDTMSGRDLFESIINFQPTHKPLLRTNHKPKIRGTDLGIWRRIHYWPYLVTIQDDEKVVKFRKMKLDPERPGILNWMLAGLKDYLVRGLRPPTVVCKATKEYQREMNTVGQWIEARCESSTIGAKLYLSEIHEKYAKWSTAEHGWAASKQKLAEELRARGYEEDHPRNLTRFKLRIRPDEPDEAG